MAPLNVQASLIISKLNFAAGKEMCGKLEAVELDWLLADAEMLVKSAELARDYIRTLKEEGGGDVLPNA